MIKEIKMEVTAFEVFKFIIVAGVGVSIVVAFIGFVIIGISFIGKKLDILW